MIKEKNIMSKVMKLTLIHSNIEKRRGRRKTINGKIEKVLGKLYAVSDGI